MEMECDSAPEAQAEGEAAPMNSTDAEPETQVRVVHGKTTHMLGVTASDTVGLLKEVADPA